MLPESDRPAADVLDPEIIEDLRQTFGPRLSRIFDEAIIVMQRYDEECRRAADAARWEELARAAHRLRGGAGMIGAVKAAAAAARLEEAGLASDRATAAAMVATLHDAVTETVSALRRDR